MPRVFASLIQSDFSFDGHGNLEAVIQTGGELRHWFRDGGKGLLWTPAQIIVAQGAAGPGAIIQSDFRSGDHGNFEVVAPLRNGAGGADLWHFFHDNSDVGRPWQRAQMIAANVGGPGIIIQSDFSSGDHGNFEVVAPLPRGNGLQLRHFFHDNADVALPWRMAQFVTDSCSGWGCLIQSDFREGGHGNFELLVEECTQSIVAYWHPNKDVRYPWLRHRVVLGEPAPPALPATTRIAQLTGEYDRTGWDGAGTPPYAHNRTESAYQIRGTDLGVSFPHRGRTYFLFGDTFRGNQPDGWNGLDVVAYTTDTRASDGLDLAFFYNPPRIDPPVPQDGFNVPLDGVSDGQSMFVFFSTDHYTVDNYDLMGRSVLTRCDDDGFAFRLLNELSHFKFINASVQRHTVTADVAEWIGLPGQTDVLWIWGSGRYRSSDVYLAVTPFAQLADSAFNLRFFAGSQAAPAWSHSEEDATALFPAGSVGELSVRWNHHLKRWLATFNADNPRGILLHAARSPWGPWSQAPVRVFDPANGYGAFMHVSWADARADHVQDDMFDPGHFRDNDYGGEYGPYQISTHAEPAGQEASRIYFSMSTWNPYQVMLMTTVVSLRDIPS
jgi:hypothetical protein